MHTFLIILYLYFISPYSLSSLLNRYVFVMLLTCVVCSKCTSASSTSNVKEYKIKGLGVHLPAFFHPTSHAIGAT